MAKKLKKSKKGLSPKAKFVLVNAGKGIISNQSCIDGSKEGPWWVASIFFALSVLLPLIPGLVKNSKVNGGDFISGYNYGFDNAIAEVTYNMTKNKEELKVEKGLLHYYKNETLYDEYAFKTPDADYFDEVTYPDGHQEGYIKNSSTGQYDLRIFMWEGLTTGQLQSYVTKATKQKFVRNSIHLKSDADPEGTKYYTPNIMVLTHTTFAVALYKSNTTTQATTSYGGLDWKNTSSKVGLVERLSCGAIDDEITLDKFVNDYHSKVLKQFRNICNEAYLNQKKRTTWGNFGIYAGIYAGIILFLGLMLFVLTRGKANPFKCLNVWHCQKIAWWAAFTPAVLGMILAFIFSGNMIGQMAFVLLVSLRVMWLSMKQLRPVVQQQ